MRTSEWLADLSDATQTYAGTKARLREAVIQLISLGRELAMVQAQERTRRIEIFEQSRESSVSGRDREADAHNVNLLDEIIRLKGDLAAYSEERDYLRFLIEHWSDNAEPDDVSPPTP